MFGYSGTQYGGDFLQHSLLTVFTRFLYNPIHNAFREIASKRKNQRAVLFSLLKYAFHQDGHNVKKKIIFSEKVLNIMLRHLHIENLAIAETINIELASGFNVLTGETGAGKSLFIKALSIVSGAKVSHEIIRSGADELKVFATFSISENHPVLAVIQEHHIPLEEQAKNDYQIIIRRIVSTKGRSQAIINDTPVTLATLKNVSSYLIDIFAQHETNRLIDASHLLLADLLLLPSNNFRG